MKTLAWVAAVAATVMAPDYAVAETSLSDLLRREQSTLNTVPQRRLGNFLNFGGKSRKKPTPVSYTREWLDARPKATGDANFECLAEALYFEARGETVKGQFAVAEVIMNRVRVSQFPDSICGVVNQGTGRRYQCQFTYTCDGRDEVIANKQAYERVAKVARAVIDGAGGSLTDGATYYHTTAVRPSWSRKFTKTTRIGVHLFYRDERYETALND